MAWHQKGLPQREKDIIIADVLCQILKIELKKPDHKKETVLDIMGSLLDIMGRLEDAKQCYELTKETLNTINELT